MKNMVENVYAVVEGKIERGMCAMMNKVANMASEKKQGNGWIDALLMALIGLAVAIIFKDELTAMVTNLLGKITTQVNAW